MDDDFFKEQTLSSEVKANIVAEYFPQYCRILLKKQQNSVRYLDLFAGPGKYEDQKHSTPLLLAQLCAEDPLLCEKAHLIFNDKNYAKELEKNFKALFPDDTFKFKPRFGDRSVGEDDSIKAFLNREPKRNNPNPTLLFFDPFGYKGIDTLILAKFLQNWGNELFLFVNIKRINQAIAVGKFDEMMKALFPTSIEKLRKERQYSASSVQDRLKLIIANLAGEFVSAVGSNKLYHCAFRFQEEDSTATSHYIIHFTKNERGYELVKNVYHSYDNIGATLDRDGNYTFDAKKTDSTTGLDFGNENIKALSRLIAERYKGQQWTAKALYEDHQKDSKFSWSHYTDTLRYMIVEGMADARFTDTVNHKYSVIISETCILNIK
ncbi:three-Cys-motif partner protein [Mucilaginibacter pineti]|uniref:Three-Cys-motif partner protein n=1 Tax=Mucilaginibacter pineti TaxID=1391627 RepID=A0A1G7L4I4_9SPHI|nr:three-Cys-motif partner protein TcmP [Mucilaginibacter pineti]SDF44452.1 three-Cys-motif partner protein [Mucilaginibacter pineti]